MELYHLQYFIAIAPNRFPLSFLFCEWRDSGFWPHWVITLSTFAAEDYQRTATPITPSRSLSCHNLNMFETPVTP